MAEEYGKYLSSPRIPALYRQNSIPTLPILQQQRKQNQCLFHTCLPKVRTAQTSTHNQVQLVITALLARNTKKLT